MRQTAKWMLVPAVLLAGACAKQDETKLNDALKSDLALASQAQPYQPQQFVGPTEGGYVMTPYGPQPYAAPQQYAPQPAAAPAPARRTTTAARRTSSTRRSSGSSSGSSRGTYSSPAPVEQRTRVVKHTKRDAAIGAAAGAIIGATTSRDKVKGAVIGGVAGGILGAVIGNNVDVQRKPY